MSLCFPLCLDGWVLLDLEDDGSHAGNVTGRLGGLRVEVAELGDPLPFRAGFHLRRLGHQFLLGRSGGRASPIMKCAAYGIVTSVLNLNSWIKRVTWELHKMKPWYYIKKIINTNPLLLYNINIFLINYRLYA